jgi:hypothetical protein
MFGAGLHRCIGAHIARMELRVALEEIHDTWTAYSLDENKPVRRHTGLERGTDEFWLTVTRRLPGPRSLRQPWPGRLGCCSGVSCGADQEHLPILDPGSRIST